MPIDGGLREKLATGTVLVAKYKGAEHRATVVAGADGKRRFRLADGQEFKSPSSAGSAVMGGVACNGWRFWSLEEAPTKRGKASKPETAAELKTRPQCGDCGKTFVSGKQLEHHRANAERLCRPA